MDNLAARVAVRHGLASRHPNPAALARVVRAFFFDIKTGSAQLSKEQLQFIKIVQAAQGYAGECRSVEDAVRVVMGESNG